MDDARVTDEPAPSPETGPSPVDPGPPERIPREIWVLVGAALVIALGYGIVAPVLPRYAKSFGVDNAAASFIISIFAIFRLVFAPVGGAALGRLGERPVYLIGLAIVAVSTVASAFAHSYGQLLLYRGVGGIGSVMFTVSAMGLVVRLAPTSKRGAASSAYASAFLIGGTTGPFLGGVLARYGIQVPFLVYGVSLVVAAVLVAVLLPASALRSVAGAETAPPMPLADAMALPAYRACLVSSFANGWSTFGVRIALVPLFIDAALHADSVASGTVLTLFAVANTIGTLFTGRVLDTVGRKPPLVAGLIVSAAATLVMGWSPTVVVLSALSVVAGVGAGLLGPAQQASVGDIVGRGRGGGQVLATFQAASDLGAIVGPVAAGYVADHLGFGPAFLGTGIVLALAAGWWVPQRPPKIYAR